MVSLILTSRDMQWNETFSSQMDAADSGAESELAANTRQAREKEIPAMQPLAVGTFEF